MSVLSYKIAAGPLLTGATVVFVASVASSVTMTNVINFVCVAVVSLAFAREAIKRLESLCQSKVKWMIRFGSIFILIGAMIAGLGISSGSLRSSLLGLAVIGIAVWMIDHAMRGP